LSVLNKETTYLLTYAVKTTTSRLKPTYFYINIDVLPAAAS